MVKRPVLYTYLQYIYIGIYVFIILTIVIVKLYTDFDSKLIPPNLMPKRYPGKCNTFRPNNFQNNVTSPIKVWKIYHYSC